MLSKICVIVSTCNKCQTNTQKNDIIDLIFIAEVFNRAIETEPTEY